MQQEDLQIIELASLIHDVWKLFQRGWDKRKLNKYSTAHSEVMYEFIEENTTKESQWIEIAKIASYHHSTDFSKFKNNLSDESKFLAWCIYMWDNISSSERIKNEEKNEKIGKQPIVNIFSEIFENINQDKVDKHYKASTIDEKLDNIIFNNVKSNETTNFSKLSQDFKEEFKQVLKEDVDETTIDKVDILLQKYFTFVPSDSFQNIPDISLYDHSKTVAMFSKILYNFYKDKKVPYSVKTEKIMKEVEVNLIWWDFASIQKYINNNISTSYITKILRAKSFSVQLLQEAILQYVLDKFNLTRTNVLISAWWKFIALSNNKKSSLFDENMINLVKEIETEINNYLFENWFKWVKFILSTKQDIVLDDIINNFQDILVNEENWLYTKINNRKHIYSKENFEKIFFSKNLAKWYNREPCQICKVNQVLNNNDKICDNCQNYIRLWQKLVKDFKKDKKIEIIYQNNNKFIYRLDFWNNIKSDKKLRILLNNWDYKEVLSKWKTIVKSVNLQVPISEQDDTKIKTFEEIKWDSNYLVMVKWDVDLMSFLLKCWFNKNKTNKDEKESNYTISRILTFSRLLDLFFWDKLEKIINDKFKSVYTVYSWWDDFVFIVSFNEFEDFITSLYDSFYKFTHNSTLHFSLWLWIFKDKTPIKYINQYTEELLWNAKKKAKQKIRKYTIGDLSYSWISIFNSYNTFVLNNKEIDWDYNTEVISIFYDVDLEWLYRGRDTNAKTLLYKTYITLKQMYEILNQDKKDLWQYVLLWARLLYLISRAIWNTNKNTNKWVLLKNLLDKLKNIVEDVWNIDNKKQSIVNMLVKLEYLIYRGRVREKKP